MIIWQGYGFIAFLLPILLSIPFGEGKYMGLGWIIGGVILYLWGKKLHNPEINDVILYDENGQGYRFKKHTDTLFWIPMEYCGILWAIGGIAYTIFN